MVNWDVVGEDALIVLTLLLLEAVLSFDNAAILAAMVRKLPVEQRKKALLYGLGGAYALRITAIFLAAWLIKEPILRVIGGSYLVYLLLHHLWDVYRHRGKTHGHGGGHQGAMRWLQKLGVPALVATIIQIELIDLAFALDQVVAAVGFTDKLPLIIIASVIGILFLRIAATYMARIMDWLPALEHMAFVAVGFVGTKLILEHPVIGVHINTYVSIAVTLGLFGVPIALKLLFDWPKSAPGSHELPAMGNEAPTEE